MDKGRIEDTSTGTSYSIKYVPNSVVNFYVLSIFSVVGKQRITVNFVNMYVPMFSFILASTFMHTGAHN